MRKQNGKFPSMKPVQVPSVQATREQRGFSLLEVLVALAITSLASLALFQSIAVWITISSKTTLAAERAIGDIVHDRQFRNVVHGLTPAWPTEQDRTFIGKPTFFSGLSYATLHRQDTSLEVISIELVKDRDAGAITLDYATADTGWTIQTYGGANEAVFDYLGVDGAWYSQWPPRNNPETGPFNDANYYPTPQLPTAIRLTVIQSGTKHVSIASLGSDPVLPVRDQDLARQLLEGL